MREKIQEPSPERPLWPAMKRGWSLACPCCDQARLFASFLKVQDRCPNCGTDLHHQRADDAPPYFTMFIVGHVVIALLLIVERRYQPDMWIHLALWLPMTVLLSLWLLPRVKGALIGLQWALRMHGFGAPTGESGATQLPSGRDIGTRDGAARGPI